MKKSFLGKLAYKKLVGKHITLDAYNWIDQRYGEFSGVVSDVFVTLGAESINNIELSITLDGFEMPFIVNDWDFKKKVKITK